MYCDNCGCELGPDMKVCPVCGKKLRIWQLTTVTVSEWRM